MKLQLLILLSTFSALSLQSPVPQTIAALASATDLPISAPSGITPTPIKLFGDDTSGDSMASAFSSDLSSAVADPTLYLETHHWVLVALFVGLGLFIGLIIWGYKRSRAGYEGEEYDDQDDGSKPQSSNNNYGGGQSQGSGGGQGQSYGGGQGQGYVGGQTQGYASKNGGGKRGAGGGGKEIDEKEDEGEESGEGEE